ncbi:MAG: N-acetylmuramoyl-L-alanine amidase [Synergistes sp.]|nr:N-acetylmuramoyl-L-alanine amidase [Synergistes sp.]
MLSLRENRKLSLLIFIAAAFIFLFASSAAFAGGAVELWDGQVKKGNIPVRTDSSVTEVAIDEMLMSLGLLPNKDLTSVSAALNGRKIEFWNASNIVRSSGKIVSLSKPVSFSDGHWWGEAGGVRDAVQYFFASAGTGMNLRWGSYAAQGQKEESAADSQPKAAPEPQSPVKINTIEIPKAYPSPEASAAQQVPAEQAAAEQAAAQRAAEQAAAEQAAAQRAAEQQAASEQVAALQTTAPPAPEKETLPPVVVSAAPFTGGKKPIVVVDAGHGDHDPGAQANGAREKDINLLAALQLKTILRAYGVDVRLTRETDVFLKLAERTEFANKNNADVFVSLHCNAMPKGRSEVAGLEYYIMAPPTDRDAMNLAIAENKEISAGVDNAQAAKNADRKTQLLLKILGDMQQNDKISESTTLAEMLHSASKAGGLPMRKVMQAPFFVLRGAGMAAVLVEMGYLTNAAEAARLKNPLYRDKLLRTVAQGIVQYIREHPTQREY